MKIMWVNIFSFSDELIAMQSAGAGMLSPLYSLIYLPCFTRLFPTRIYSPFNIVTAFLSSPVQFFGFVEVEWERFPCKFVITV